MNEKKSPLLELRGVRKSFKLDEAWLNRVELVRDSSTGAEAPKKKPSSSSSSPWPLQVRPLDEVSAVNGVDLKIEEGEIMCLVGESGCGKSTLARLILKLIALDQGEILYQGERIDSLSRKDFLPYRKKMQMVFQNPFSSLNPRFTVRRTLEEPLNLHFPNLSSQEKKERMQEVIHAVGLNDNWLDRYPHEFSGGQRQRIGIARALMVSPEFLIADEPISALDISIQSQILNLLKELKQKKNLTYLFITHNLSIVQYFADRICVMYLGHVCEVGERDTLFREPVHPYTQAILSAIPNFDKPVDQFVKLEGEVSTPLNLKKTGCVFSDRCIHRMERCEKETPLPKTLPSGSQVACHLVD